MAASSYGPGGNCMRGPLRILTGPTNQVGLMRISTCEELDRRSGSPINFLPPGRRNSMSAGRLEVSTSARSLKAAPTVGLDQLL